jgi:hypothetical protein
LLFAWVILALATWVSAHDEHQHPAGNPEQLGTVHFPVSCTAEAQAQFQRALAIQHSFWFEEAEKAFAMVTVTDPSCAMGYWGIAMSLYHPLWEPPDATALQHGWEAVAKAKNMEAKTERERDYIAAIEAFYKDAGQRDHRTRALAYEQAMEQEPKRFWRINNRDHTVTTRVHSRRSYNARQELNGSVSVRIGGIRCQVSRRPFCWARQ